MILWCVVQNESATMFFFKKSSLVNMDIRRMMKWVLSLSWQSILNFLSYKGYQIQEKYKIGMHYLIFSNVMPVRPKNLLPL